MAKITKTKSYWNLETISTYESPSTILRGNDDRQTLINLISHPAGFSIELFGLCLYRNKDGQYVCSHGGEKFDSPSEAVDFFLRKRQELRLGYDYDQQF